MNLKIQAATTTAAAPQHQHERKANFGALVSAIHHGDMTAAQTAYDALQSAGSDRFGWSRKGDLSTVGQAIASGDADAAKKALKTFQQSKGIQPTETATTPTSATNPADTAATTASTETALPVIPTISTPGTMVNLIV